MARRIRRIHCLFITLMALSFLADLTAAQLWCIPPFCVAQPPAQPAPEPFIPPVVLPFPLPFAFTNSAHQRQPEVAPPIQKPAAATTVSAKPIPFPVPPVGGSQSQTSSCTSSASNWVGLPEPTLIYEGFEYPAWATQ